jgi:hypothetical protein
MPLFTIMNRTILMGPNIYKADAFESQATIMGPGLMRFGFRLGLLIIESEGRDERPFHHQSASRISLDAFEYIRSLRLYNAMQCSGTFIFNVRVVFNCMSHE